MDLDADPEDREKMIAYADGFAVYVHENGIDVAEHPSTAGRLSEANLSRFYRDRTSGTKSGSA